MKSSDLQVYLPWKQAYFPLRPHQVDKIEYDAKGAFLRVLNAGTNRRNKCRVYAASAPSLRDLVGKTVSGTVRRTGDDYVALLVDRVEGLDSATLEDDLVRLARRYVKDEKMVGWHVRAPRSWTMPVTPTATLGPHVSLHPQTHWKDVGRRVTLRVADVMHWTEASRWVALVLDGPLLDRTGWVLHMSCAQEPR